MEIWVESEFGHFFAWRFTDRERKLPEAKEFTETIKKEFKHKTERMYFREENRWLINKLKFNEFMDIHWNFVDKIVNKQSEMEFERQDYD